MGLGKRKQAIAVKEAIVRGEQLRTKIRKTLGVSLEELELIKLLAPVINKTQNMIDNAGDTTDEKEI